VYISPLTVYSSRGHLPSFASHSFHDTHIITTNQTSALGSVIGVFIWRLLCPGQFCL
jgi:hypothetical protein